MDLFGFMVVFCFILFLFFGFSETGFHPVAQSGMERNVSSRMISNVWQSPLPHPLEFEGVPCHLILGLMRFYK